MSLQTIHLDQHAETPVTHLDLPHCHLRYAYARSWESRSAGENGQDCLSFSMDKHHLCFALCDGVSMSYMGDLASNFLCRALVEWMPGLRINDGSARLEDKISTYLNSLTGPASKLTDEYRLPQDLSPLLVSVLEEKRQMGSESMFISGLLDFDKDCLTLAWMGDSRLEMWPERYEFSRKSFSESFRTHERWSSRKGVHGQMHTRQMLLSSIQRLTVFSDGLAVLDRQMKQPYSDEQLTQIFQDVGETPTSDDLSLLEIQLVKPGG